MRTKKTVQDLSWINDDPLETEVEYNDDGSVFIPIYYVEAKLYRLDTHWSTENFQFNLFVGKTGAMFVQSSLELVITYGGKTRRLVGSSTEFVPADVDFTNPSVNSNYSATLKSENIKNAVKAIGKAFGSALNERDAIATPANKPVKNGKQKPPPVKMKPDKKIQEQFNKAFEEKNGLAIALQEIYEIQYTGNKLIENAES